MFRPMDSTANMVSRSDDSEGSAWAGWKPTPLECLTELKLRGWLGSPDRRRLCSRCQNRRVETLGALLTTPVLLSA